MVVEIFVLHKPMYTCREDIQPFRRSMTPQSQEQDIWRQRERERGREGVGRGRPTSESSAKRTDKGCPSFLPSFLPASAQGTLGRQSQRGGTRAIIVDTEIIAYSDTGNSVSFPTF